MKIDWMNPDLVYLLLAAGVAVFGVGRLSRVLTVDLFPPAAWVRMKWSALTRDGDWSLLARCFWCATPWIMAVAIGWFWVGTLVVWIGIAWWIFWGWLALAYIATIIIARDEPAERE